MYQNNEQRAYRSVHIVPVGRTLKSSRRDRTCSAGSTELISVPVRSSVERHQRTRVAVLGRVGIGDAARVWTNGPVVAAH